MRIRRVEIQNFRGIKQLSWIVPKENRLICLVGPGDSTKSTIIDAMYLTLCERYSLSLTDTDFFGTDVEEPIVIRVALDELSNDVMRHSVLGLELSGIKDDGSLTHDPGDGHTTCVVIQLKVDADLEPVWSVYREGGSEPFQQIGVGARKHLSAFKVDERIDGHLRWTRTSALGRLTDATHGASATLAAATRASRDAVAQSISEELKDLTKQLEGRLNSLGTGNFESLQPGLDTSLSSSAGVLALYEGRVPLTSFGLGTRRLAGVAAQQLAYAHKSILMIDEIEYGLEPHRLVYLLHRLRASEEVAQVFVTTHSPVAVEQLAASDLCVVRCDDDTGVVSTHDFTATPNRAQAVLRSNPSAFLASKVILGEGKTEFGLLLGLVAIWDAERREALQAPAAGLGVAIAEGGSGSDVPRRAQLLREAGFAAVVLMDNDDRSVDTAVRKAVRAGVVVRRWGNGNDTERELVASLSTRQLSELVAIALEKRIDARTILQDLRNADTARYPPSTLDVDTWIEDEGFTLEESRALIAAAAKQYSWFKNPYQGKRLATWITTNCGALADTELMRVISQVRVDIYGDESLRTLDEDEAS